MMNQELHVSMKRLLAPTTILVAAFVLALLSLWSQPQQAARFDSQPSSAPDEALSDSQVDSDERSQGDSPEGEIFTRQQTDRSALAGVAPRTFLISREATIPRYPQARAMLDATQWNVASAGTSASSGYVVDLCQYESMIVGRPLRSESTEARTGIETTAPSTRDLTGWQNSEQQPTRSAALAPLASPTLSMETRQSVATNLSPAPAINPTSTQSWPTNYVANRPPIDLNGESMNFHRGGVAPVVSIGTGHSGQFASPPIDTGMMDGGYVGLDGGYGAMHGFGQGGYSIPFGLPGQAMAIPNLAEPARQPFYQEYRVRVGDQLVFIYHVARNQTATPYRLAVGDVISIDSDSHEEIRKEEIPVMTDGTISVSPLQSVHVAGMTFQELKGYLESQFAENGFREPRVTILPVTVNLPNQDLRDAVDGRQGDGGQRLNVTVTWDGYIWLPKINAVPVVGLSLMEIAAEVNARYAAVVDGIEITPTLDQAAASFAYVLGEVEEQGRIEIRRPATVLQAITQAGGHTPGANLRNVIVVRRTADWQLIATRLDLHAAGFGKGIPCDDIFVHDGDIIIVPRSKIERMAELVELYFTRTIYAVIPNQGFTFAFAEDSALF